MKSLALLLAILPLAFAVPASQKVCVCDEVFCPAAEPFWCRCMSAAEQKCHDKCGGKKPKPRQCEGAIIKVATSVAPTSTNLISQTATAVTTTTASPWPTATPEPIVCGGFVRDPVVCPTGQLCVIPMDSPCRTRGRTDCTGVCVGSICGGYMFPPNGPCPRNQICVDHPETSKQSFDFPGYCQLKDLTCKSALSSPASTATDNKCPDEWQCAIGESTKCDDKWPQRECGGVCVYNSTVAATAVGARMFW